MKKLIALGALALLGACGQESMSSGVAREIERAEQAREAAAASAVADSQAFLDAQRARQGVQATASGLLYEVRRPAPNPNLARPSRNAQVLVHYEGRLPNGEVFDSSFERGQPAEFPLAGVVPGFAEALMLMRPGEEIVAYLPAPLGYGEAGMAPGIPPNTALQFRIQLLAFAGPDGRIVAAPGLERR
ncbi:MAG: FKBP-type peptidyl-prolyl cis-trans isomerase [Hyphomonadaceae bacterium]